MRLATIIGDGVKRATLTRMLWKEWRRRRNRLTSPYDPAFRLIHLLDNGSVIDLTDGSDRETLPGFLFDMNAFFERLVTKVLVENLVGVEVRAQHRLNDIFRYATGWNPQRRQDPTPRPDLALFRNGHVACLLDAKYRDLWEAGLPRDMLYQLAIYALSQSQGTAAVLLYSSCNAQAKESRVEVADPTNGSRKATVICRPVDLVRLASLLDGSTSDRTQLGQFAKELCRID
jgi:5-methylcytosine-specific restriction enzyme subunit McrC